MKIQGTVTLKQGRPSHGQWVTDDTTFPLPTPQELESATLTIKLESGALGGCGPAIPAADPIVITSPTFPVAYVFDVPDASPTPFYGVRATLSMGWTPSPAQWIRKGDWLTQTAFQVRTGEVSGQHTLDVYLEHYPLVKSPQGMDITGKVEIMEGWHNGTEWIVNDDTFPLPTEQELANATLTIKINQAAQFGGGMPSTPACSPVHISSPVFPLIYHINVPKPEDPSAMVEYSVSAVLNVGWKPEQGSQKWIQKGDWLTTTSFVVHGYKDGHAHQDIFLVHYPLRKSDA